MLEYYQKKVFGSSKIGGVFELRLFESCLFVLQVLKKMFHNSLLLQVVPKVTTVRISFKQLIVQSQFDLFAN